MPKRRTIITSVDKDRLQAIINSPSVQAGKNRKVLAALRAELERATVVEPGQVLPDVITMNSRVKVRDMDSGKVTEYMLVYPHSADSSHDMISILAPIGTALLGYRMGDIIKWKDRGGIRTFKVESVIYQPEAAGDINL